MRGCGIVFAVIIPYFQRAPGVLRRALVSIATQDVRANIKVYVVDDASPAPPQGEVSAVEWPSNISARIIKKENGGPGSARNLGLDSLEKEEYVAFLDSDDTWSAYHLSSALYSFEQGFDFYTAESTEADGIGKHQRYFANKLPLVQRGPHPWAQELAAPLLNFAVAGPMGFCSAMVVKRSLVGNTRFDAGLRTAGEDGLFAASLAVKQPRVLVSARVDVRRGRGVNIFSEGDWGSRPAALRAIDFLRSRLLMRPLVLVNPEAQLALDGVVRTARQDVWRAATASVRRGTLPTQAFLKLLRDDPVLLYPRAWLRP